MSIGVTIAGAGRWGPHLIRNFANANETVVRYVVDTDPTRLEAIAERFPGIPVTTDYEMAISDNSVDAVVIATPAATHYPLVSQALERGRHVLVEKPLATRLTHAEEVRNLAHVQGVHLMVGHVFLFNGAIKEAGARIRAGELGDVYYLSMLRTNLGPVRSDANAAWDLAAHDISIANNWLNGVPITATASGGAFINAGIQDVVFATLTYPDGKLVHLHASWLNPRKSRFVTAVGSERMLTVNDMDLSEPLRVYDRGVAAADAVLEGVQDTFAQFRSEIRDGEVTIPSVSSGEPLAVECRSFISRILGSGETVSDGSSGVDVVRVLDALDRSLAAGSTEVDVV